MNTFSTNLPSVQHQFSDVFPSGRLDETRALPDLVPNAKLQQQHETSLAATPPLATTATIPEHSKELAALDHENTLEIPNLDFLLINHDNDNHIIEELSNIQVNSPSQSTWNQSFVALDQSFDYSKQNFDHSKAVGLQFNTIFQGMTIESMNIEAMVQTHVWVNTVVFKVFNHVPFTGQVVEGPNAKGQFRCYWAKDQSTTWHTSGIIKRMQEAAAAASSRNCAGKSSTVVKKLESSFAPRPQEDTRNTTPSYSVGDKIKCRWKPGNAVFCAATITGVNQNNGTYQIKYDDGTEELNVSDTLADGIYQRIGSVSSEVHKLMMKNEKVPEYLLNMPSSSGISSSNMSSSSGISSSNKVHVDMVLVDDEDIKKEPEQINGHDRFKTTGRCKKNCQQCKLQLQLNGEKKIVVDVVDVVNVVNVVDVVDVNQKKRGRPKTKNKQRFKLHDKIYSRFLPGNCTFYKGTIIGINKSGTYQIKYADGDVNLNVSDTLDDGQYERIKFNQRFDIGDKVRCRRTPRNEKFYSGTIIGVNQNGTYQIRYWGGDVDLSVSDILNSDKNERIQLVSKNTNKSVTSVKKPKKKKQKIARTSGRATVIQKPKRNKNKKQNVSTRNFNINKNTTTPSNLMNKDNSFKPISNVKTCQAFKSSPPITYLIKKTRNGKGF